MKMTEPKLDERKEQPYMGIRLLTHPSKLSEVIPQSHQQVFAFLSEQGVAPAGPPFIRYHVIDMQEQFDISLGVPVASAIEGRGAVRPAVFPAGRYAALIYTGIENGIPANGALIEWGAQHGLEWDRHEEAGGDAFVSRYESFMTDPADEPDMSKWETEVAIKVADTQA